MSQDEFTASESDREMEISLCKDKQISSSVTVMITPMTIDNANLSGGITIPVNDRNSPNRAGNHKGVTSNCAL